MQPHQRQVFSIPVVVEGLMSATQESLDGEALSVRVARQFPQIQKILAPEIADAVPVIECDIASG